jgi:stage II sporulation protein D
MNGYIKKLYRSALIPNFADRKTSMLPVDEPVEKRHFEALAEESLFFNMLEIIRFFTSLRMAKGRSSGFSTPSDVIIHRGNSGMITSPKSKRKPLGLFLSRISLPLILLFFVSCAEMPHYKEETFYPKIKQPAVTVKLLQTDESIVISPQESFVIKCYHAPPSAGFTKKGDRSIYYAQADILVGLFEHGLVLSESTQGELEVNLTKVFFLPKKDDSYLFLNGKPYRGTLEVILSPKGPQGKNSKSLVVLNIVYMEDYLKGVVPAEIGKLSDEEIEALKAQAIAARTYSLSRLGQYGNLGYDLEASVVDQVYNGVEGENPLANKAIKDTKGRVLVFGKKLIHAYYHANCGGRTEYIEKVWDKPPESYLIPMDDDDFCSWAKNYTWEETWNKEELERNISIYLDSLELLPYYGFGNLVDLIVKERSPSGRIEVLEVVTDSGTYQIHKDKIRWAMKRGSDPNLILPSTLFDLEIQRGFDNSIEWVTAKGHGNGHGVGMCQTGAIGMARKGYSYKEILTHYYPGVKITKCY